MRKYIVGALVGFLLSIPFTTFGAQIQSMIGKQIKVEYPVIVDGKLLNKKAIATDGTSYTPNAAIGEATGYDVKFENKTIIFSKKGGATVANGITAEYLDESIAIQRSKIKGLEMFLKDATDRDNQDDIEKWKKEIADCEAVIAKLEQQKTTLVSQPTPTP